MIVSEHLQPPQCSAAALARHLSGAWRFIAAFLVRDQVRKIALLRAPLQVGINVVLHRHKTIFVIPAGVTATPVVAQQRNRGYHLILGKTPG